MPIEAGGRLTGRARPLQRSALVEHPDGRRSRPSARGDTNFSVRAPQARHPAAQQRRRDVHAADRSASAAAGATTAYGVDGTFAFFDNLIINTYWARTSDRRPARRRRPATAPARLRRRSLRRAAGAAGRRRQLQPGDRVRAPRRHAPQLRAVPLQPAAAARSTSVRKFSWIGLGGLHRERRRARWRRASVNGEFAHRVPEQRPVRRRLQRHVRVPAAPFPHRAGVTLPVGGYDFDNVRAGYNFGQQRRLSGNLSPWSAARSTTARKTTLSVSRGRAETTPQLSLEPTCRSTGWTSCRGRFTTASGRLARDLHDDAADVRQRAAAVQLGSERASPPTSGCGGSIGPAASCSSSTTSSATRWRRGFPDLANRAFIVKINRLLRF